MTRPIPREWLGYQYFDPEKILVGLREVAFTYRLHDLNYHARTPIRNSRDETVGEVQGVVTLRGLERR